MTWDKLQPKLNQKLLLFRLSVTITIEQNRGQQGYGAMTKQKPSDYLITEASWAMVPGFLKRKPKRNWPKKKKNQNAVFFFGILDTLIAKILTYISRITWGKKKRQSTIRSYLEHILMRGRAGGGMGQYCRFVGFSPYCSRSFSLCCLWTGK